MTEQIKRVIAKGNPLAGIKTLITKELLRLDRAKFEADMRAEYDELFPKYKEMTDSEKLLYIEDLELQDDTEKETIEYPKVEIDYSEDENYITFEQYKNETRVIQEAVEATYDEDGMVLTEAIPEVTELVRQYVPVEVTDEMVQAELDKLPEYKEYLAKKKQDKLNNLYVAVNDKVFDAHLEARLNMATAIQASSLTNQTEAQWKMYDNSVQTVTVGELQQALILALTEVGKTIGAIDGD
jgi:hypothetical protein